MDVMVVSHETRESTERHFLMNVVKKFGDEKPDDPSLGFCDFLKVEMVQLTSDSYDEFQQETGATVAEW